MERLKIGNVIMVKTGDYRQKWMKAIVTHVSEEIEGEEGEERTYQRAAVEFVENGHVRNISDVEELYGEEWFWMNER